MVDVTGRGDPVAGVAAGATGLRRQRLDDESGELILQVDRRRILCTAEHDVRAAVALFVTDEDVRDVVTVDVAGPADHRAELRARNGIKVTHDPDAVVFFGAPAAAQVGGGQVGGPATVDHVHRADEGHKNTTDDRTVDG